MILVFSVGVFAADTSINMNRCAVFNDTTDSRVPSKIGLSFILPDSLMGKEIIYAELKGKLSVHHNGLDSLFELRIYPLISAWPEGVFSYQDAESISDSMSAGVCTIRLGDSVAFNIDVTSFVREIALRERSNFGLIGTADLLGDSNIRLPDALGERLRDIIKLRVIYK
jgi:hypothetical protein